MPEIPMLDELYVGKGVNDSTGRTYGVAITFDPVQSVTGGGNTIFELQSISSSKDLTETLNVNASASFKGGFGVSAEFHLARSVSISNYYTYALIRVIYQNPPVTLRNPRFTPEAQTLLTQKGWDAFAASYGFQYMSGYVGGGSYYALLEVQTTSETQQQDVKAKLSGYYGPFSASADFALALKDIAKTTVVNVYVAQSGGDTGPVATTIDEMLGQAKVFPAAAKANPVPTVAIVEAYEDTVPLPSNLPPPDSTVRLQQRNTLNDLGAAYLKWRDYISALNFVLAHLPEFDDFRSLSSADLQKKRDEFTLSQQAAANEIDEIVKRATACAADFTQCKTYVSTLQPLALPTIGGQLMTIKEMEDRIAALEKLVGALHIQANGGVGIGTANPSALLHVAGNNAILNLEGTDHVYSQWFPKGQPAGRRGWMGYGGAGANSFTVANESPNELNNPGRLHITTTEDIFLLAKGGTTYVSSAWGGPGNLVVDGTLTVSGPRLVANGILSYGQLNKLDIQENFTAVVRCGDFTMGISGRRGNPGRALVDGGDKGNLFVNFGPDWPNLRLEGHVTQGSSKEQKENIVDLSPDKARKILDSLNPIQFSFRISPDKRRCLGFIAEEVPWEVGSADGKGVSPMGVLAVLVKTMQEQVHMTHELASALEEVKELERRIGAIIDASEGS